MMEQSLYDTSVKKQYTITQIPDIALLASLGIREGVVVELTTRYAFGGPVLLCVQEMYNVAIGKDIAKQIFVSEVHS